MIAITARELNQYRLHRLMKVIFIGLLIATFILSWWLIFAPVNSQTPWKIAYPEDAIYRRESTDHFIIGDERIWETAMLSRPPNSTVLNTLNGDQLLVLSDEGNRPVVRDENVQELHRTAREPP